jgi:hypothetical protein
MSAITNHADSVLDISAMVTSDELAAIEPVSRGAGAGGNIPCFEGNVFFRLVESSPAAIMTKADTGEQPHKDSVVVKFLNVCAVDHASKQVIVCEPTETNYHILDTHDVQQACESFRTWKCNCVERYWSPDFRGELNLYRVLNAMRSVTDSTTNDALETVAFDVVVSSVDRMQDLEELACRGVVECVSTTADVRSWKFTEQGLSSLQLAYDLESPELFIQPRIGGSLQAMSPLDLIGRLEHEGWALKIWNAESKTAFGDSPPPYKVANNGPKHWWSREGDTTVMPAYLRCLLRAKELGIDVAHFMSARHYAMPKTRLQLLDDTGVGVLHDLYRAGDAGACSLFHPL